MSVEKFIQKFAEQFDETPIEKFTPEANFRELDEWSSMAALSIIAMVDEEYNVALTGNDIRDSKSIGDIYTKVTAKIQ